MAARAGDRSVRPEGLLAIGEDSSGQEVALDTLELAQLAGEAGAEYAIRRARRVAQPNPGFQVYKGVSHLTTFEDLWEGGFRPEMGPALQYPLVHPGIPTFPVDVSPNQRLIYEQTGRATRGEEADALIATIRATAASFWSAVREYTHGLSLDVPGTLNPISNSGFPLFDFGIPTKMRYIREVGNLSDSDWVKRSRRSVSVQGWRNQENIKLELDRAAAGRSTVGSRLTYSPREGGFVEATPHRVEELPGGYSSWSCRTRAVTITGFFATGPLKILSDAAHNAIPNIEPWATIWHYDGPQSIMARAKGRYGYAHDYSKMDQTIPLAALAATTTSLPDWITDILVSIHRGPTIVFPTSKA